MPTITDIYNQRIEEEKKRRASVGLDPNALSPEWLAGLKNDITQAETEKQAQQYLDPKSSYYQTINKQIRSQITGASGADSLLALTVAMGGSPAQAQEQIKALQAKTNDTAGNLISQYYLNASGQGNSLLSNLGQLAQNNSQFQTQLRVQNDQYDQQKKDSLLNTALSGVGAIGGFLIGGPMGAAAGSQLGKLAGNKTSSNSWYQSQPNVTGGTQGYSGGW